MARFNPDAGPLNGTTLRHIVQVTVQGQVTQCTFDYIADYIGPPAPADLNAFQAAWIVAYENDFLACLPPVAHLTAYITSELFFAVTPSKVQIFSPGNPGTAGVNNLPLEMAAVVDKTSSLRGQHGRSRTSMMAVPDTFTTPATSPNIINGVGLTAYNALWNLLIVPLVAGGHHYSLAILTRPVPPLTLYTKGVAVNNYNVNPNLGTAKRRKPGRGQ
jgi:hypothetical protein